MPSQLQQDLTRFFVLLPFDVSRTREIADIHVSPKQREAVLERLRRFEAYGNGSQRTHARELTKRIELEA